MALARSAPNAGWTERTEGLVTLIGYLIRYINITPNGSKENFEPFRFLDYLSFLNIEHFAICRNGACRKILKIRLTNYRTSGVRDQYLSQNGEAWCRCCALGRVVALVRCAPRVLVTPVRCAPRVVLLMCVARLELYHSCKLRA